MKRYGAWLEKNLYIHSFIKWRENVYFYVDTWIKKMFWLCTIDNMLDK